MDAAAEFVWTLIEQADSPLLVAEVAEALRYRLAPPEKTPKERRLADFGLLRVLINAAEGASPGRDEYDGKRTGDAPSSRTLVDRYGTWWEACAIAARMEADGRLPPGRTFSGGRFARGREGVEPYTVEEVVSAVRLCAFSLGRPPTSSDYYDWSERERAIERERKIAKRCPSKFVLARLFPGTPRWPRVLAAAAITDAELQHARAALLRLGRGKRAQNQFGDLPLSQAAALAAELHGSLDWLAGRTSEAHPVADPNLRFSPERFRALRDSSHVAPQQLIDAAGLTISQSRRLVTGTFEPTLVMVVVFASLLGVAAADLCDV